MDISSTSVGETLQTARSAADNAATVKMSSALKNSGRLSAEKTRAAAEKFETMFLSQMLSFMQPEIDTDGMFMGGKGEEVFKSFMTNEHAKIITATGRTGITDMVERELIRMQSEQQI